MSATSRRCRARFPSVLDFLDANADYSAELQLEKRSRSAVGPLGHLARKHVLMAVRRWSVNAAFPTQQPLWLHVKRMTQLYQLDRVHPRAPALPAHNLFHTVACQFGKLAAVHVGLGHGTGQALADPLLLGSVIFLRHRRASLCPTVAYCKMLGDGRLSRAKDAPRGMRPRRCSGPCRTMRSGSSLEEQTRKT